MTSNWGGKRNGSGRPTGHTFDLEKAKELRELKVPFKEISRILSVSYPTLWKAFKKLNLTTPRKNIEKNYDWKTVLEQGRISIQEDDRSVRRYIRYDRRQFTYARVLWNVHHPDDVATANFIIHHKDLDTLNDTIDNLQKLTRKEHSQLHGKLKS